MNFENDFYRYNVKHINPALHGNVQMKQDSIVHKHPSPKKLDERSIRRLAEINLGLRQNRSTVDIDRKLKKQGKMSKPNLTRKMKSTFARSSLHQSSRSPADRTREASPAPGSTRSRSFNRSSKQQTNEPLPIS